MMNRKIFFLIVWIAFLNYQCSSQALTLQQVDNKNVPHINYVFNRILNGSLTEFYKKLADLKLNDTSIVSIVHIGDSHLQADLLSGIVRRGLQQNFGNAGRGLIFPYQLARSNAPPDISSYSNTTWTYNRLAHPGGAITAGISGFSIQSNTPGATINIGLKPDEYGSQEFKKIKLFVNNSPTSSWDLRAENNDSLYAMGLEDTDLVYHEVSLEKSTSSFSLSLLPTDIPAAFYGASLESGMPGILYHTIGVNGARYDQYNNTPLFWQQLPALKADLFIVSLGTNEAQNNQFDEVSFRTEVGIFLQKLKIASPNAAVLITIPADSYKGGHSNTILKKLNTSLYNYCTENDIAVWDLYRVTNGYNSAHNWVQKGLMSKDRVHFNAAGYRVQGQLLLNALQKGYNDHLKNVQNFK